MAKDTLVLEIYGYVTGYANYMYIEIWFLFVTEPCKTTWPKSYMTLLFRAPQDKHHPIKFGGHSYFGGGVIIILVCFMI